MNTKKKKQIALITILLLSFFITKNGFSEDENNTKSGPTNKFHLSLGGGVAIKNNIRKNNTARWSGGDVIALPIPLVQIAWGPISMGAQGLNAQIYANQTWGAFINFNRTGDKYESTGMDDRLDSWFFGGGFRFKKINVLYIRDIQGRSRGKKLTVHYAEMLPLGEKILARASVGVECYNQSYADYYFGVKANEATTDRPEYHPNHYCLPTASFLPMYRYSEKLNFISGLSFKGLTKEIRHSPTTTGTWLEAGLIAGATWAF